MNRRDFIRNAATALFGFTVLPPATTYSRVWRATKPVIHFVERQPWQIDWETIVLSRTHPYDLGLDESANLQFAETVFFGKRIKEETVEEFK